MSCDILWLGDILLSCDKLLLCDKLLSCDILLNQSNNSAGGQNVTFLYDKTLLKINGKIMKK